MSGHLLTWNSVPSSSIPGLVVGPITRQLVGDFRGSFLPVPGLEGAWMFPELPGRRKIQFECFVEAETFEARRLKVTQVANWLDLRGQYKLIVGDVPDHYYEAVLADAPDVDEWRQLGKFDLTFSVNPYTLHNDTSLVTYTADANESHTWDSDSDVFTYPVISITPNNGNLTDFFIILNGRQMEIEGLIAEDATVVINGVATIVTTGVNTDTQVTGVYSPADRFMSGVSGKFPIVTPGSNTINFFKAHGTATDISVSILYRRRYRD